MFMLGIFLCLTRSTYNILILSEYIQFYNFRPFIGKNKIFHKYLNALLEYLYKKLFHIDNYNIYKLSSSQIGT